MTLPEPFHPALVHFPIALLVFGAGLTLLAAVVPRRTLAVVATLTLLVGTLGTRAAKETGEDAEHDYKQSGKIPQEIRRLIHEHEEAGEAAMVGGWVATGLAAVMTAAVWHARTAGPRGVTPGWRRAGIAVRALALAAAIVAAALVLRAGHLGGKLVYERGVGVQTTPVK